MNIDINILPRELRAHSALDPKMIVLIVLVGVLAGGCYYFFAMKSSGENDIAALEQSIASINREIDTVATNPEIAALNNSIKNLQTRINSMRAANKHYDSFMASMLMLGDALYRITAYVPPAVDIQSVTQSSATLTIKGAASDYGNLTAYAYMLDKDEKLTLISLPPLSKGTFTIGVNVAMGGDE